jgi:hypothetical protein
MGLGIGYIVMTFEVSVLVGATAVTFVGLVHQRVQIAPSVEYSLCLVDGFSARYVHIEHFVLGRVVKHGVDAVDVVHEYGHTDGDVLDRCPRPVCHQHRCVRRKAVGTASTLELLDELTGGVDDLPTGRRAFEELSQTTGDLTGT